MSIESPECKWMREVDEKLEIAHQSIAEQVEQIAHLEEKCVEAFKSSAGMMSELKQRIARLEHEAQQRNIPGFGIGQAIPIVRSK